MSVPDDVRKALDHNWRAPHEIHKKVGAWAPTSIARTLTLLTTIGLAEARGPMGTRQYRAAPMRATVWGFAKIGGEDGIRTHETTEAV